MKKEQSNSVLLTDEQIDEIRPAIHAHMTLLVAAGAKPAEALAVASLTAALAFSDLGDQALRDAFNALSVVPRIKAAEQSNIEL